MCTPHHKGEVLTWWIISLFTGQTQALLQLEHRSFRKDEKCAFGFPLTYAERISSHYVSGESPIIIYLANLEFSLLPTPAGPGLSRVKRYSPIQYGWRYRDWRVHSREYHLFSPALFLPLAYRDRRGSLAMWREMTWLGPPLSLCPACQMEGRISGRHPAFMYPIWYHLVPV